MKLRSQKLVITTNTKVAWSCHSTVKINIVFELNLLY